MSVYQAGDGRWIFWNGEVKHYFSTVGEALQMSEKVEFCDAVRVRAGQLITCIDNLHIIADVGVAQGYKPGQSDPIADPDAVPNSAVEIGAFFTVIADLQEFIDTTVTIDAEVVSYRTILNRLRSV